MRGFGLVVLFGCGNQGSGGGGCGSSGKEGVLDFTEPNNYAYTSDLTVGVVEIQAGANSCMDWSTMTTDLRGRPMDPGVTEQLLLVEFVLGQDEVIESVELNTLKQSDSQSQWLYTNAGGTDVCMDQFEIIGNPFIPATGMLENSGRTWLTSLVNNPEGRLDILMSKFVVPLESSTNTAVDFTDGCTTLTIDADLEAADPIVTQAGLESYVLDWSGVAQDVNGIDFDSLTGDELLVAKFDLPGLTDIEELFLRLDSEATELYRMSVYGETSAVLEEAEDSDGNAFAGFTTDGIWLVGIGCTTCTSPAPLLLAVVEVE